MVADVRAGDVDCFRRYARTVKQVYGRQHANSVSGHAPVSEADVDLIDTLDRCQGPKRLFHCWGWGMGWGRGSHALIYHVSS